MLNWYFKSNLLIRILLGLILGVIAGIIFHGSAGAMSFFKPFGDIFINLLKMIIAPVILFSLIMGTASIKPSMLGKVGVKIIVFYLLTSLFAIVMGLIFGNIISPASGGIDLGVIENAAAGKAIPNQSAVSILIGIIPTNPFEAISKGNVLQIICFSIFFGISLAFCRDSKDEKISKAADVVFKFFEGCSEVIFKVVGWIMQYAPIGVFALIFVVFSKTGLAALKPLASTTFAVYLALICQLLVVYGGLAVLLGKVNPVKFFKKVSLPMVTAFVTRSSGGTLPVSMETAENKMGIKKDVYSFTLPLGSTINMDGTTIYLGVCAIFIANAIGMPLSMSQQGTVVLTAVLASIGTAGVPGAGVIMLMMVLNSIGLPVEAGTPVAAAYAMILGIDAILDMGRTAMNVVGDLTGTLIVARSENMMDMDTWNKD